MEMNHFIPIPIQEPSHVTQGRRIGAELAEEAGFSETDAGKVAIAITEASTNLVKHGGGGELLLRSVLQDGIAGIELLALDKGPGMANVGQCMEDGYSTGGSPGTGLGAIARQSAFFDLYSTPQKGTALLAQFWAQPFRASSVGDVDVGGVSTPKNGEEMCGDGWGVKRFIDTIRLVISDGLGHGHYASEATKEAIRLFMQESKGSPSEMIKLLHQGLKSTRGAAAAVIEANPAAGTIVYAGVGNTVGAAVGPQGVRHMVSYNGTLGHQLQKVQEFTYSWPQDTLLVFMTDGLQTQWSLDDYPGLIRRHPTLIAGVLYRDFNRGRDDATVVVAKRRAA
jgi:anti-sigma regulatory factor (Ser/Thr protein kinase)